MFQSSDQLQLLNHLLANEGIKSPMDNIANLGSN